jgi:hypothetical protein
VGVGDGVDGQDLFEVEGVLDLEFGLNGDGGEDICEKFGGGGGYGVATRDNGATTEYILL